MPSESFSSERTYWVQDVNTMLVSALCHLVLLIALGLSSGAGSGGGGGTGDKITVMLGGGGTSQVAEDAPPLDVIKIDKVPETAADVVSNPAAAMAPQKLAEGPGLVATDLAALTSLLQQPGGSMVAKGAAGSGIAGTSVHRMLGPALGGGSGGDGTGVKASTEFFGIGAYGQTFVYVVDCSDSMNENGKFERARYELLHSIEQLSKDQRYFVIFYNQAAHPMDAQRPMLATQDQIAQTTRWVNQIEADGGTNPLPALLHALSMRPDAIYFLSDGQFDPNTIRELRFRNRANIRLHTRAIPIHAIAFFDRFAEGLMRTIARNSGGEYRFVK